jgi:hypothetical protein
VLKVCAEKLFGLQVAGAGGPARADGGKFAGVVEGLGAVEVSLGWKGKRRGNQQ